MRSSRVLSVVGLGSVLVALGCSSSEPEEASAFGVVSQASLTEPVLNEILINPPSTDTPFEFIELRGPAGLSLSGYSLAYLEGDSGTNQGKAMGVWALSGTIGSNGLFVVRDPAGHSVGAGTNVLDITGFPGAASDAGPAGQLQNGAGTIILVKGAALALNATYGASAGALNLPSGAVLLDSVSITDRAATEVAYGPIVTVASGTPDAVSRFLDDTTPNSAAAWYGGDLVSGSDAGAVQSDVTYSATARSSVMPENAVLTPGAPNWAKPLAVDGGAATDAGSVQDASVATDGGVATDAGSATDASLAADSGTAADAGSVQDASAAVDASFPPVASDPYLNEIVVNPPGDDFPYEYIEIKGTPGASLAGFSVAYVDGDAANVGVVKKVWALSGNIGANGFFVLKAPAGAGHAVPADTTIQGVSVFATSSQLENGAGTVVLYRGGTLTTSTDYDANNDGTLELPSGVVVVDSVATTDDAAGFVVHGPLVTLANGQPDAVSRLVGSTGRSSAAAWYGGDLLGTNASVSYDQAKVSPNTPAGAVLTPGAENSQGAPAPVDAGAPVVDAGPRDAGAPVVDAGPRDAGAPVVDAGSRDAGSPVVDAGLRDAGATDSGAPAVDAGARDAGARDAGAVPSEQTFGEGEGGCGCAVVGSERTSTQPFAWVALGGFAMLVSRRRRR
jgi:MYXO-CTERM domain-containing protein